MTPNIPDEWEFFNLKNIQAFNSDFDILIDRKGEKLVVRIKLFGNLVFEKKLKNGERINISLNL